MVGKESDGRASRLLLVLVIFVFAFGTYNLLTMVFPYKSWSGESFVASDSSDLEIVRDMGRLNLRYHVVMTATDSAYSKWQSRIMYFWYKRIKDAPGSDMGGFTRVLHSGKPDNLMDEIPTFVVDPLPRGVDRGYVVLNRPWAFVQWLEKTAIEEEYILMAEPDHIFVNPLPNLAHGDYPVAFPFGYIRPSKNEKIIRKYYSEDKGPITNVDPIGNSPVIIKKSTLQKIAPTWMNVSLRMKQDRETDKAFGWVLEMYGYAVASALHNVQHILRKDFMIQPPFDLELDKKFIIHYTYGSDYTLTGKLTYGKRSDWQFDKRRYIQGPPPRNLSLPPPGVPHSVVQLVEMVNEASANIPGWNNEAMKYVVRNYKKKPAHT